MQYSLLAEEYWEKTDVTVSSTDHWLQNHDNDWILCKTD